MFETDAERALECRNRAEDIRKTAQAVRNDAERREALPELASEFTSLADDIEGRQKPERAASNIVPFPKMAERRFSDRRRVFESGKIISDDAGAGVDCAVRNISGTGALITVLSAATVPGEFELLCDSHMHRCTVVWRTTHGMGVKFESQPMS